MSKLFQATRQAVLFTPLGGDVLVLRSLHATEQLGRLFSFEIEVSSELDDIQANDLLGQAVAVELNCPAGGRRYFHGFVNGFSHAPRSGRRYHHYRLNAVPWLWFLTRHADCRIFQNMSVPDILRDVFRRRGFSAFDIELHGSYDPWEYCVQYRETDFNFVSRLMEQEGIYYYFKHTKDEHKLVLVDSPEAHQAFPHYERVSLKARDTRHGEKEETLSEWRAEHRHHTGVFAQTDYDFTRPRVDLSSRNHLPGEFGEAQAEVFDYPGEYVQHKDGEDWAKVRMEEIRAGRVLYYASGGVCGIATGYKFSLEGPPGFKNEGDYLVVGASTSVTTGLYETGGEDDEEETFSISCTLIPAAEPFRSARLTPKPVIQGIQTAVVTGPRGEEIFTDKYGRIKVQFHWDREGKYDESTTCWIRVAEAWAGKRWGSTFTPRMGQEVVVAFLEGDPDQPLVVGSVYNGEQMPPYLGDGPDPKHKNDPNVSGVKSCSTKGGNGYNEWRFDDSKGKEEIFLHAERNFDTRVKHDVMETVGGNRHLTVGTAGEHGKTGDQFEMVYKNKHLKIHNNQEEHIGGNLRLHIGGIDGAGEVDVLMEGRRAQTIKRDDWLHVEGKREQTIDSDQLVNIGGSAHEKTYKENVIEAGTELHLKAGTVFVIEAGTEFTIKCGAGFISLKADGTIALSGKQILLNSGGSGGYVKSARTAEKRDAITPEPPDPVLADNSKTGSISTSGSYAPPHQGPASGPAAASGGGAGSAAPAGSTSARQPDERPIEPKTPRKRIKPLDDSNND